MNTVTIHNEAHLPECKSLLTTKDNHIQNGDFAQTTWEKKCDSKVSITQANSMKGVDDIERFVSRDGFVESLLSHDFVDDFVPEHQYGPDYIIPTESTYTTDICGATRLLKSPDKAMSENLSVVTTLQRTVNKYPHQTALAVKRGGVWITWSYQDYWTTVWMAAKGFIKLGLKRFNAVCLLGFNAPEWVISLLAGIFAGGVTCGIYTSNSPEACRYILNDCEAQVVVVENDLQLQKILLVRHKLPHLKAIIQYTGQPTEPGVLSWNELLAIGRTISDDALNKRIRSLAINQCCLLIYTSGTMGNAKGVMINHDNMLYIAKLSQKVAKYREGKEKVLSYLPLSHVASQLSDVHATYCYGSAVYFANADALKGNLIEYLKDVQPTYIVGVPRIWEKVVDKLKENEVNLPPMKRALFRWARKRSLHHYSSCQSNDSSPSVLYLLAKKLVFKKVRKALGMQKIMSILSGGAPLNSEVMNYLASVDLWITESYGMTETCGPNTLNCDFPLKIGSVGKPFYDLEIEIKNPNEDGTGEVCMRGRHVFMGYLGLEDQTQIAFDKEGWFRTGDIGRIDSDKYLFLTGRIKELVITAGGENIAPIPIEDRVKKEIPIISNCMLVGDRKKFLTMLLTLKVDINMDTLLPTDNLIAPMQEWCKSLGSNARSVSEVLNEPDMKVLTVIQEGMDRVNDKAISNAQRVQKWVILPKDFSIPGGEFGPTMKVKRAYVLAKYATIIDSMYQN